MNDTEKLAAIELAVQAISLKLSRIIDILEAGQQHTQEAPAPPDRTKLAAKISTFQCPQCKGPMRLRENRQQHTFFAGCANYPDCKGCRTMEGEESTPRPKRTFVLKSTLRQSSDNAPEPNYFDDDTPF